MATKVGSAYYDLGLNDKPFKKGMKSARSDVINFQSYLNSATESSRQLAVGLGLVAGATLAFGVSSLKTAANLETMEQGFVTLLGSSEEADKAIKMIKKDAAATPFELPGLIQANQLLTAVTKDANRSEGILLNVGKALSAMGKGQPELDRIIVNLQQIGAVGKASMMDIKQFAFAGIPIFEMLQEETGLTGEKLEDFIGDGKVTFEVLEQLFLSAGAEGGRFEKAFESQAGTFNQLWSNMKDNITIFGAEFIKTSGIFDLAKQSVTVFIGALDSLNKKAEEVGGFGALINETYEQNKTTIYLVAGAIVGALVPAFASLAISIISATLPLIPFMIIGGLIALLAYELVESMGGWDEVMKKLAPTIEKVKKGASDFYEMIKKLHKSAEPFLKIITDMGSEIRTNLGKSFKDMEPQIKKFQEAMVKLEPLGKLIMMIAGAVFMLQTGIVMGLINGVVKALPFVIEMFVQFLDFFGNVVQTISKLLQGDFAGAFESWKLSIMNIYNFVKAMVEGLWALISGFVGGVVGFFKNLYDTLVGNSIIPDMVNAVIEWINKMVTTVLSFVNGLVNQVVNFFFNMALRVLSGVNNMVNMVWNGFQRLVGGIIARLNAGREFVRMWIVAIVKLFEAIVGAMKRALSGASDAIIDSFKGGFDYIKNKSSEAKENLSKLNPLKRESPSIVDWINRGTKRITSLYDNMFSELGSSALQTRAALTGTSRTLDDSVSKSQGSIAEAPLSLVMNMSGVMARSKSEIRDIALDLIDAANEGLVAKGRQPIGTSKIIGA